jgi:CheY-like chemotaxis protein
MRGAGATRNGHGVWRLGHLWPIASPHFDGNGGCSAVAAMATSRAHRKANVLAVDDNAANLLSLEAVLGRDHNVICARSGQEALDILRARSDIDVILLDVQMPVMDGFETAARIKELPGADDIPIIFVTAVFSEDPYVKRGFAVGGVDYFSKPFDPELLRLKVDIYASFRLKAELLRERDLQLRQTDELLQVGHDLSAVLEKLPAGVLIADPSGRICQMTDEASRVLVTTETERADVYGQLMEWWAADDNALKQPGGMLERALKQGESFHSQRVAVRCLDGSKKDILASVLPLRGVDGVAIGAVFLVRDIAVAPQIEPELEERVTRLVGDGIQNEESAHRSP